MDIIECEFKEKINLSLTSTQRELMRDDLTDNENTPDEILNCRSNKDKNKKFNPVLNELKRIFLRAFISFMAWLIGWQLPFVKILLKIVGGVFLIITGYILPVLF